MDGIAHLPQVSDIRHILHFLAVLALDATMSEAQVCLEYLERYYVLISYAAYLFDPSFDPDNPEQPSFGQWMRSRPELRRYAPPPLPRAQVVLLRTLARHNIFRSF